MIDTIFKNRNFNRSHIDVLAIGNTMINGHVPPDILKISNETLVNLTNFTSGDFFPNKSQNGIYSNFAKLLSFKHAF